MRRAQLRETGEQVVILSIVASRATLSEIENSLLSSDAWDWETHHREDRQSFSHRRFTILRSWKGAVKRENSDPEGEYDYQSLKGGSRHSDKSSE